MRIRKQPLLQLGVNSNIIINNINGRSSDTLAISAVNLETKLLGPDQEQSKNNKTIYIRGSEDLATGQCNGGNTSDTPSSSSSFSSSSKKGDTGYGVNWLNKLRTAKGFPNVLGDQPEIGIERFLGLSQFSGEEEEKQGEHMDADDGRNRVAVNNNVEQLQVPNSNPSSPGVLVATSTAINSEIIRSSKEEQNDLPESSKKGSSLELSTNNEEDTFDNESIAAMQFYSTMFADLFCMGSSTSSARGQVHSKDPYLRSHCHRRRRKQENPKVFSANGSVEYEDISSFDRDPLLTLHHEEIHNLDVLQDRFLHQNALIYQGSTMLPKSLNQCSCDDNQCKNADAEVGGAGAGAGAGDRDNSESGLNLGNEIFIIDTSLHGWNVEKLITRNGKSWKIQDKQPTYVKVDRVPDCSTKLETKKKKKKKKKKTYFSNPKSFHKAQIQWVFDNSFKEQDKDDGKCEMDNKAWSTTLQTQIRSRRKRRSTPLVEDTVTKKIWESIATNDGSSEDNNKSTLASDHPANLPKEGLSHSIYQVFMQAGKTGLTAREAVSRILEQGLPGLHEGGVVPRVEVLKVVSNSPYFMPLEESKYILCSALVGDDGHPSSIQEQDMSISDEKGEANQTNNVHNMKVAKHNGLSQYWAALRRARTGKTSRKPSSVGRYTPKNPIEIAEAQQGSNGLSQVKRLKFVKQDATGLGNRCNRSDGKGWHCPLRAKIGYLLCDHHLGRLRARVKTHIKSKIFSMNRSSKDEQKRVLSGSWVVKKVVERSRIGRHAHGLSCITKFPSPFPSTNVDTNDEHDPGFA